MAGAAALGALGKPGGGAAAGEPGLALDGIFPGHFGEWQIDARSSNFVRPPTTEGKAYGLYDQVLERVYANTAGERMMLSVAYGREQSAGMQLHRPEVCYRFGGFRVEDVHPARINLAGRTLPVTQLLATKPGRSEPLTYWATLGDELVESRIGFRWRQLTNGLQRRLLDGMLVRISSIDADAQRAYLRQAQFASALVTAVPSRWLAKVVGQPATDQPAG